MEQVHRVVLSHLDYDGEGKILEVGCGSGALAISNTRKDWGNKTYSAYPSLIYFFHCSQPAFNT